MLPTMSLHASWRNRLCIAYHALLGMHVDQIFAAANDCVWSPSRFCFAWLPVRVLVHVYAPNTVYGPPVHEWHWLVQFVYWQREL